MTQPSHGWGHGFDSHSEQFSLNFFRESILGERIEFYDVILGKFCGEELMIKVKSEGTFLNVRDVDKIVEKMIMDNIKSTGQKLNINISK